MTPEVLVTKLKMSKEYLDRSTRVLEEEDSGFAPDENAFTVAVQMAHIGITVDWIMEGAFGKGFNMDFGSHEMRAEDFTSLAAARGICDRNYQAAIDLVSSKTAEELNALCSPNPVVGEQPKWSAIDVIVEHTAHHRGALSVYTRLLGKVPPMPYMDVDAAPIP